MAPLQPSVDEIAKSTLGLEDSNRNAPAHYVEALTTLLKTNPMDVHFIMEFGQQGKEVGGNGFGSVTCMEDFCWKDIILGPDPSTPLEKQRKHGLGSFFNYRVHCQDAQHVKGRNERCKKEGNPIQPTADPLASAQTSANPPPVASSSRSTLGSQARAPTPGSSSNPSARRSLVSALEDLDRPPRASGPPRHTVNTPFRNHPSPQNATRMSASSSLYRANSQVLDPIDPNNPIPRRSPYSADVKPKEEIPRFIDLSSSPVKGRAETLLYGDDDDDDDDIIEITGSHVPPGMRNGREAPIIVRDSSSPAARTNRDVQINPPQSASQQSSSKVRLQNGYLVKAEPSTSAPALHRSSSGASMPSSSAQVPPSRSASAHAGPSSRPDMYSSGPSSRAIMPKAEYQMPGALPGPSTIPSSPAAIGGWYNRIAQAAQAFAPGYAAAATALPSIGLGALATQPGQAPTPAMPGMYPAPVPAPGLGAYPGMNEDDMLALGMEYDRPDNLQEFFSNSLDSFDDDQDVEGALRYLGLPSLQDRYKDLAVTLMPHQVLGVRFMLEQERNSRMRGGLLADSMGLGKTLSSIATMVGNPSQDRKVKTTLVIAPLALLQQWKSEIETKALTPRKVLIYWGQKRTGSPSQLKQYDVVITTYGILNAEHGAENKPKKKKKGKKRARAGDESDDMIDDDSESDAPINPHKKGPLFKIYWYRIILDEAHSIRNRNTKASKAAHDLEGHLRWCLTGTPVVNTLCDLYSLLHFLRISPQRDWKAFNSHIGRFEKRRPKLATKRAQVILKTCSLRRNKESTLNGVRLLNLPDKIITWDELELSPEERHIYHSIETRMQVKFNSLLKRGTVLKHYSMVLVMLVRLKQCTSHPWLLTRRPEDAAHPDDVHISDEELLGTTDQALIDDMRELQRAVDLMGQEYCDKVARKLEERHLQTANAAKDKDDAITDTECAICFEPFEHEHAERITQCFHSFCATCTDELFNGAPRTIDLTEDQQKKGMRQCPMCREAIERNKCFRASAFFNPNPPEDQKPEVEESPEASTSLGKRSSPSQEGDVKPVVKKVQTKKGKGKAVDRGDDAESNEKPEVIDTDLLNITPSTKMKHLMDIIEEKLQDPTVKIVAYSQFTSFLDLCGSYLRMRGVANLQYQGSMAAAERQGVLDDFNRPTDQGGDHRVLLLSLKAGGVGLNLTISNVVVALDLAWNAATEDQAVDRCHRIGQTKEVDVRRLVVKDTIDQRIRHLQETKRSLADGALGEGQAGKVGRMNLGDLIRLFGVDGTGEDV